MLRLTGFPNDRVLPEAYRLTTAASPHYAAERDGITIDASLLTPPAIDRPLVIEPAGGLAVPLTRNLLQMKGCLAAGFPFVFGFTVYDSFESDAVAKSGKLNMPKQSEGQVGGHAVLAVGYDDKARRFIVRNSWGNGWGQKGYFTMPYDYLLEENLSDDFWTLRVVEENPVLKKKKK